MAKPFVYVVPGFLGVQLFKLLASGKKLLVWANPTALATDGLGWLRLNAAGTEAFDAALVGKIQPGAIMPNYYNNLVTALVPDYQVRSYAMDFRKSVRLLGDQLWADMKTFTRDEPFYVVAHSYGGLVARMAWKAAKEENREAQFQRIITLGTPHWGSYSAFWSFTGMDETVQDLTGIASGLAQVLWGALSLGQTEAVDLGIHGYVQRTLCSWPAIYNLLPSLDEPNHASYDSARSTVYQPHTYDGVNRYIAIAHLDSARVDDWPRLAQAIPPGDQLISIYSTGSRTVSSIFTGAPFDALKQSSYQTADGDGKVTVRSASVALQTVEVVGINHGQLPNNPVVIAKVLELLQAVSPPLPEIIPAPAGYDPPAGPFPTPLVGLQPGQLVTIPDPPDIIWPRPPHDC